MSQSVSIRHLAIFRAERRGRRQSLAGVVDLDLTDRYRSSRSTSRRLRTSRVLGLRSDRTVDKEMARPDADHPAPGAGANQRPNAHLLEVVREDVAMDPACSLVRPGWGFAIQPTMMARRRHMSSSHALVI